MDVLPLAIGIIFATVLAMAFFIYTNSKNAITEDIESKPIGTLKEEFSVELTPSPVIYPQKAVHKTQVPDIPHNYGFDRLVLLARDPEWLYAYWEISATKREEFKFEYGRESWEKTSQVLRVYDITGISFTGDNANSFTDIAVNENVDNWHIKVNRPNRTFCVDIGRIFPGGRFVTLLRSNIVWTPRASLSDKVDEEWMWIEGIYNTISRQVGVSSPLILEDMERRMKGLSIDVFSPGFNENKEKNTGGIFDD